MRTHSPFRHSLGPLAVLALTLVAACGPSVPTSVTALDDQPGIANLLKERLRTDLLGQGPSPAPFSFPTRLRIVPYDYQSALQQVDVLAQFDTFARKLKGHPELFSDVSVLPAEYGASIGASFDGLLKLRESVRADAFFLISGRTVFVQATEKQPNFFEWWAHKSYWEANVSLQALFVEAPTGYYLPSLQAAAKAGPAVVVPDDDSTTSGAYGLRHTAESGALDHLADALVAQLSIERTNAPKAMPSASSSGGSPTPTPGGNMVASPTPSANTPTSSPTVSPSAAATSPAASGPASPAAADPGASS